MQFVHHHDPIMDGGGKSNVPRKSRALRMLISATKCLAFGHDLHGTGYANAHQYSHTDWRIGRYDYCTHCQCRVFDLKTPEQFKYVIAVEQARWDKHFEEQRAEAKAQTA